MEPLRHIETPGFGAVIFRRTSPQIHNEGGLWDTSETLYPAIGLMGFESRSSWEHPVSGANIKFAHMQYEKDKYSWQGSQIALIAFDELTHFTKSQFLYMLSRNRSMTGIRPYMRATCNPDPESWVAELIAWWIDQDEDSPRWGLPIPERAGVLRWFVHLNDEFIWADTREELEELYPAIPPKSLTFIPAKLEDNQILMQADPGYLGNLLAQSHIERSRLLDGNWKIRASAGLFFKRGWFEVIKAGPAKVKRRVRYWDLAGTETEKDEADKDRSVGPAWTVGTLMSLTESGEIIVEDVVRERISPFAVERLLKNMARIDGDDVWQVIERDPGQAGKFQGQHLARLLKGFKVHITPVPRSSKESRADAASAQAEAGNVKVVEAAWNSAWFTELEGFPDHAFKDQVDSFTGGFKFLVRAPRKRSRSVSASRSAFHT